MGLDKIGFIIVNMAVIVIIYMIYSILKNDAKRQTHYSFLALLTALFIWISGTIILEYCYMITGKVSIIALDIAYIGLIFSSPLILILGIVFAKSDKIKFSWKYVVLFIIPLLSVILLFTNNIHHLFYKYIEYEELTSAASLGSYFGIHTAYSYICTLIGMGLVIISSVKNTGIFSRQSIFILFGILTTFVFNFLLTMQIIQVYFYTNGIAIFFSALFFFIAIFKFKFLDLIPIALQRVVNIISDGYVVLNERNEVIDFNNAFVKSIFVNQGENFVNKIDENNFIDISASELTLAIDKAKSNNTTIALTQKKLKLDDGKFFDVEVSPIFLQKEYRGTILLFKDITQHVKDMEIIKQSQGALIEQEKLATLGQLAGGMAHDINTPLSTIVQAISYFEEFEKFENEDSNKMLSVAKISTDKIGKIVNSVRNQIRNIGIEQISEFSIRDVVKNVELLLFSELKKINCIIELTGEDVRINGDMSKLEQVIMNFVINSLQAYQERNEKNGIIKINLKKENANSIIEIIDYAGGIPKNISESLFKQILTTKGTKGTGFGLYFSNSIIKGVFNGKIEFNTEENKGTEFYINIPIK